MKRFITFLMAATLLGGCAAAKLSPQVASDLRSGDVAAAFYVEGKRIVYDEMVYKVLWNENRSQTSDFEGAWDVDREMSGTFAESLRDVGVAAQPIENVLGNAGRYASFVESLRNTRDASGMNAPLVLSGDVRDTLLNGGIEYVMLLRAAHFQVQKVSGFKPIFSMPSLLYVYDVRAGTEHYREIFNLGGAVQVDKSPREVEANNLAKLRTATDEWVKVATTQRLPDALGLAGAH